MRMHDRMLGGNRERVPAPRADGQLPAAPLALRLTYWSLPLLLTFLQATASVAAMHHLRYEELAESVRNVFWLQHGYIYDGISSNGGWYGLLLLVYHVAGFSLFTAKWVKVGLFFIALCCSADLLRRAIGHAAAFVPLLCFGLSPTILYFNTLQTSYGTDLSYFAICLWLIMQTRFAAPAKLDYAKMFLAGAVAMIAAESYPTFLFYIPAFALLLIWLSRHDSAGKDLLPGKSNLLLLLALGAGFTLPLALSLLAVRNPRLLIYDARLDAGLFRGGGHFTRHFHFGCIKIAWRDLFVHGNSYYFEIGTVDFHGLAPVLAIAVVAATTLYLLVVNPSLRVPITATLLLLVISFVAPAFSIERYPVPGIRRCTGALAAVLVLFAFTWNFFWTTRFNKSWLRPLGLGLCGLLVLSDAMKYPRLLRELSATNVHNDDPTWCTVKETPTASLNYFLEQTARGDPLPCVASHIPEAVCRYPEIYAALQGYRLWNHQPPVEVKARDWTTGAIITLTPELWVDHHFPD